MSLVPDTSARNALKTGIVGVDEIASHGGGLVCGALYLLFGDPGAGKSSLSLAMAGHIARKKRVVYATTEEHESELRARAERFGLDPEYILSAQTQTIEDLISAVGSETDLVVLDSLQGMRDRSGKAVEHTIKCVRPHAQETNTCWMLINHIIKTGEAAGTEKLQHDVDALLYLSVGGGANALRTLISPKNRLGPSHRPVFLAMTPKGLRDVVDATSMMLADRVPGEPGSVVAAVVMKDAQTAVLVEVQALLIPCGEKERPQINVTGYPMKSLRKTMGILSQRAGVLVEDKHVHVNVSGGVYAEDPGLDLPVALAIASAHFGKAVPAKMCVWGELGLVGEIRAVREHEVRDRETVKAGYRPLVGTRRLRDALKAAKLTR